MVVLYELLAVDCDALLDMRSNSFLTDSDAECVTTLTAHQNRGW